MNQSKKDKIMHPLSPNRLKPSTDFGGSQVKDYSTQENHEVNRPGGFSNIKKSDRDRSA